MPQLLQFMVRHLSVGFAIGAAAALALLAIQPQRLPTGSMWWLAGWLYVFSFGAPFALGSLASAMMMDEENP